jgi:hypothetical protein
VFDFRFAVLVGLLALVLALILRQYTPSVLIALAVSPLVAVWRGRDTGVVIGLSVMVILIWIGHWPHLVRIAV